MKIGFNELDEIIDLEENNLIVVGDRTAIGKTTFVSNIALNIAKQNIPVLFFSFNKSKEEILSEMTLSETFINIENLVIGKVTQEDLDNLKKTYSKIQELPLYIKDQENICINDIYAFAKVKEKCKELKTKKNVKLIIIDDIQCFEDKRLEEHYIIDVDLSDTCYGIKELSKELNIPIIVTSQLSSGLDYRPKIEDLKYPSSLEKDADTIMLLYRENFYNPNSEKRNIAEIDVVKNKNGKLGLFELLYIDNYKKFVNIARNI